QSVAERLGQLELRFDVKAGPTGSLFGSVTPTDITDELWSKHKIRVDRRKIGTDTIKRIGRYQVPIELFQDVTVELRTLVVPEGGELPPAASCSPRARTWPKSSRTTSSTARSTPARPTSSRAKAPTRPRRI